MEILTAVIKTLGTIEVHGKDNLNSLLGCINALEELVEQLKQQETSVEEQTESETDSTESKEELDG